MHSIGAAAQSGEEITTLVAYAIDAILEGSATARSIDSNRARAGCAADVNEGYRVDLWSGKRLDREHAAVIDLFVVVGPSNVGPVVTGRQVGKGTPGLPDRSGTGKAREPVLYVESSIAGDDDTGICRMTVGYRNDGVGEISGLGGQTNRSAEDQRRKCK